MQRAIKLILAVVFGFAVGVVLLTTFELASYFIMQQQLGIGLHDEAALQEVIQEGRVPVACLALVLAGFLVAPPIGGISAAFMLKSDRVLAAAIVGGLFFLATIQQLVSIAHPLWFNFASVIGIPTAVWLAIQRIQLQDLERTRSGRRLEDSNA